MGDAGAGLDVGAERAAANLRRARVVMPAMLAVHVAWALAFALLSPSSPGEAAWRDGLIAIHAAGAVAATALWLGARRATAWIGELITAYALAVGTAVSLNTLHYNFRLTAWIIAVMLASAAVYTRWLAAALLHAGAAVIVLVACFASTGETGARIGFVSNVTIMASIAFVLSRLLDASFVREARARRAVESMNAELERRVAAQVGEILVNAERIEALNRQLAGQVEARSRELSQALGRVAAAEHGEDALRPGAVLADRFEIAHLLGVGGMGVVYAAFDRVARAPVAVKLVHENLVGVDHAQRFLQEASATARLRHPAIVRVLHVDATDDGRLYQVQELIDGRTLDAWTDLGRTLPPSIVARLGAVLADALAVAHADDIVHRDVKPQNVMLTASAPGCRLLDFGLAKLRRSLVDADLTAAGTVVGTPQFLAPEQIASPGEVGGAADVYALGVVLYLCASGRLPFDVHAPLAWLHAHTHLAPIPLAGAPAPLAAQVMACLAKDPAARPTARALADALAALGAELSGDPLEAWAAREDHGATRPMVTPARRKA